MKIVFPVLSWLGVACLAHSFYQSVQPFTSGLVLVEAAVGAILLAVGIIGVDFLEQEQP